MPHYMDIYKQEYTTFCGCHVRKFALFIGYFSLIMSILNIIGSIANGYWYQAPAVIVCAVCCIFLLLAHYQENPKFYLPYLVITGISLIVTPFIIIFCIVLLCVGFNSVIDTDWSESTFRAVIIIYIAILLIAELIQIYFWLVVKRAKNYMELEVCTGNVHRQNYTATA